MIRDFNCYKHILAVDPGLNTTGWAMLSHKTGRLLGCGGINPFARVSLWQTIFEIRDKMQGVWEDRAGFSINPVVVAIEIPSVKAGKSNLVDLGTLLPLHSLATVLQQQFNCKKPYSPTTKKWRGYYAKVEMAQYVYNSLDKRSKAVLEGDIESVAKQQRAAVYDAIGIGLWAFQRLSADKALDAIKQEEAVYG